MRVVNMSWAPGLKSEHKGQSTGNGVAPAKMLAEGEWVFAIER